MNTTDTIERVINRINHLARCQGIVNPNTKVEVNNHGNRLRFSIWVHSDSRHLPYTCGHTSLKTAQKFVVQQLNDLAKSKESKQ